jgi:hypothetical protein
MRVINPHEMGSINVAVGSILRKACGLDRTTGNGYSNLHKIIDGQTVRTTVTDILAHPKYEIFAEDENPRQALI